MKQTEWQKEFGYWIMGHNRLIAEIRESAEQLHASVNQTYDDDKPYGFHLNMVADIALHYGALVCQDEADIPPLLFGAYYHDSIEDARLTYNDVMKTALQWMDDRQAQLAAEIVYALTNDKGRTRAERAGEHYYAGIRQTPYAPFVKLADRLANTSYSFTKSQNASNQHMREIYHDEMPHFLEAINAHSTDPRLSLPLPMLRRLDILLAERPFPISTPPTEAFIRENPDISGFSLEPLDMKLSELVFAMTKRLPVELPQEGPFLPIIEHAVPNPGWYMEIALIELCCQPTATPDVHQLTITFWGPDYATPFNYELQRGTTQELLAYIRRRDVLFHCKACALWTEQQLISTD